MNIYIFKENCEIRIMEIQQELLELESQPATTETRKAIERLEMNSTTNTKSKTIKI